MTTIFSKYGGNHGCFKAQCQSTAVPQALVGYLKHEPHKWQDIPFHFRNVTAVIISMLITVLRDAYPLSWWQTAFNWEMFVHKAKPLKLQTHLLCLIWRIRTWNHVEHFGWWSWKSSSAKKRSLSRCEEQQEHLFSLMTTYAEISWDTVCK